MRGVNTTALSDDGGGGGGAPLRWDLALSVIILCCVVAAFIRVPIGYRRTIPLACVPCVCLNLAVCGSFIAIVDAYERAQRVAAYAGRVLYHTHAACVMMCAECVMSVSRRYEVSQSTTMGEVLPREPENGACVRIEFYDKRGTVRAVVHDSLDCMAGRECVRAHPIVERGG